MAFRRGQVFGALLVVLAACEGAPARSKSWRHAPDPTAPIAATPNPTVAASTSARAERAAERGRTLTVRLEADPSHLNPFAEPERESLAVTTGTIFETLVGRGDDGEIVPGLAESFRVIGGIELRFLMRDGVKFHDGKPFTATDAKMSIDRARVASARNPALRALLADVASVEVWTPRDLRLMLRRPNGYILRALASVPIGPAHVYGGGDGAARSRPVVGTGPYRLKAWERGKRIDLQRFDGYWGAAAAIPELQFVVEPDGAHALAMATRGDLDVIPVLPSTYARLPSLSSAPSLAPLRLRPPRFRLLALNGQRPPFDDVRVREAVSLLVDRQRLAHEVLRDEWLPIGAPAWPGGPLDAEAPPVPPFDPVRASWLLEQAGWSDVDRDGQRTRGDTRLRIELLAAAGERDPGERELLTQALRRAGFLVDVRPGDPGYLLPRLKAGDFDLALIEWRGLGDSELCTLIGPGWGSVRSPALESACHALAAAPDARARRSLVPTLLGVLATEFPFVPTVAWDPKGIVSRRVVGTSARDGGLERLGRTPAP
jgi:peptide/nickel transport system substrate-binding protein